MSRKPMRYFSIFLAAALLLAIPAAGWFASLRKNIKADTSVQASYFESGNGSKESPFEIARPVQLYYFSWLQNLGYFNKTGNSVYFTLSTSLDMSGFVLPPAGTVRYPFIGDFNGNNNVISNLNVRNQQEPPISPDPLTDVPKNAPVDPQIVGFFGVIGHHSATPGSISATPYVHNVTLDHAVIRTVQPRDNQSVIGIFAGYVNGILDNIRVSDSRLSIAPGVGDLAERYPDSDTYSEYALVGYGTQYALTKLDIKTVKLSEPTANAQTILQIPVGDAWGGSIPMKSIYERLEKVYSAGTLADYTYFALYYQPEPLNSKPEAHRLEYQFTRPSPFRLWHADPLAGSFSFAPYLDPDDQSKYFYLSGLPAKPNTKPFNTLSTQAYRMYDYDEKDSYHISDGHGNYLSASEDLTKIINVTDESQATKWANAGNNLCIYDKYGLPHYLYTDDILRLTSNYQATNFENVAVGSDIIMRDTYGDHNYITFDGQKWGASRHYSDKKVRLYAVADKIKYYMNPRFDGTLAAETDPKVVTYWDMTSVDNVYRFSADVQNIDPSGNILGTKTFYLTSELTLSETAGDQAEWTQDAGGIYSCGGKMIQLDTAALQWLPADAGGTALHMAAEPTNTLHWISSNASGQTLYMNAVLSDTHSGTLDASSTPVSNWMLKTVTAQTGTKNYICTIIDEVEYYLDDSLNVTDSAAGAASWNQEYKQITNPTWDIYTVMFKNEATGFYLTIDTSGSQPRWAVVPSQENNSNVTVTPSSFASDIPSEINIPPFPVTITNSGAIKYLFRLEIPENERHKYPGYSALEKASVDTYFPLTAQDTAPFHVADANTGYIVSGANTPFDSAVQSGDIRVSAYAIGDGILNTSTGTSYDADTVKIFTRSYLSNGFISVSDAQPDDPSPDTLGFNKFESSKLTLDGLLTGADKAYGLHFMKSTITKSNIITAPKVRIQGLPNGSSDGFYDNFQMPQDCIDFTLQERGFINFFAGTYYPKNNAFFSLHQILRDPGTHQIQSILDIKKIYQEKGPDGNLDPKGRIVYQAAPDGKKATHYSGGKPIKDFNIKNSVLIFDTEWLTNPGNITQNALYYFEIPVDSGEYALGSVPTKNGAYLLYLDISAGAAKIQRTETIQVVQTLSEAFQYPRGISLSGGPTDASRPGFATIRSDGTYQAVRIVNDGLVKDSQGAVLYRGQDHIFRDTSGNWAVPPLSSRITTQKIITWRDFNTSDKTTTTKVTTITSVTQGGEEISRTVSYEVRNAAGEILEKGDKAPAGIDSTKPITPDETPMAVFHFGQTDLVDVHVQTVFNDISVPEALFPPMRKKPVDVSNLLHTCSITVAGTVQKSGAQDFTLFMDELNLGKNVKTVTMNGKPFEKGTSQRLTPQAAG